MKPPALTATTSYKVHPEIELTIPNADAKRDHEDGDVVGDSSGIVSLPITNSRPTSNHDSTSKPSTYAVVEELDSGPLNGLKQFAQVTRVRGSKRKLKPLQTVEVTPEFMKNLRVLFVDDDAPNRRVGGMVLRQLGVAMANVTMLNDGTSLG